jgi:hypothetical protein
MTSKKIRKQGIVTPIIPPSGQQPGRASAAALPPPLIAGLFTEAGVHLRPGRADIISGSLGVAVAKFRTVTHRLGFEREPGLFPVVRDVAKGKRK